MKGIPTYTQYTVAWPSLPLHGMVDEIGVSFAAKGGGTHGEFRIKYKRLGGSAEPEHGSFQICCFGDGLGAMLEPQILAVLQRLRRMHHDKVSPARMVDLLEAAGVQPSIYHLRGLAQTVLNHEQRTDLEKKIKRMQEYF